MVLCYFLKWPITLLDVLVYLSACFDFCFNGFNILCHVYIVA